jgi:hypothetical protein
MWTKLYAYAIIINMSDTRNYEKLHTHGDEPPFIVDEGEVRVDPDYAVFPPDPYNPVPEAPKPTLDEILEAIEDEQERLQSTEQLEQENLLRILGVMGMSGLTTPEQMSAALASYEFSSLGSDASEEAVALATTAWIARLKEQDKTVRDPRIGS